MEERNSLVDLERRRLQLEENVAKLRKSLQHWQQWEIEYESMKEELLGLGSDYTKEDLQECVKEDSDPSFSLCDKILLDTKETKLLMYDSNNNLRKAPEIVGLLSRRLDYVEENIKASKSLLRTAEERLAASIILIHPEVRNEEGLPVTEIHEKLDEEGNIISSSMSRPNEDSPQIVEALRKAGLESMPRPDHTGAAKNPGNDKIMSTRDRTAITEFSENNSSFHTRPRVSSETTTSDSSESNSEFAKQRPPKPKKRVSFAEDTKTESSPWDHPKNLPLKEKERLLKGLCDQARFEVEAISGEHKRPYQNYEVSDVMSKQELGGIFLNSWFDGDTVIPILKHHKNHQARRLLKSMDLNLWESSRLVYIMIRLAWYNLQSEQMDFTILVVKQLYLMEKNSHSSEDELSKAEKSNALMNTFNAYVEKFLTLSNIAVSPTQNAEKLLGVKPLMDNVGSDQERSNVSGSTESRKDMLPDVREPSNYDKAGNEESSCSLPGPASPANETLEDARLRREMLEYNMNEVGAVVAELDLDNDDDLSEDTYSDDGNGINLEDTDDEEEDEHGRASSRVLSESYLAEMQALEKKLKATAMVNAGPEPKILSATSGKTLKDPDKSASVAQDIPATLSPNRKKGVRFANDIDVHEAPPRSKENHILESSKVREFAVSPKQDSNNPAALPPPSKPTPINASKVIERPFNPTAKPAEPDELDPVLLNQQVSNEYHRLRNRVIEKEGGFLKPNERDEIPVDENGGMGGKKFSRFRAARLGRR